MVLLYCLSSIEWPTFAIKWRPLSGQSGSTPAQLFWGRRVVMESEHQPEVQQYGIDCDGPCPDKYPPGIIVPEIQLRVPQVAYDQLRMQVNPLTNSDQYGMDLYVETKLCLGQSRDA